MDVLVAIVDCDALQWGKRHHAQQQHQQQQQQQNSTATGDNQQQPILTFTSFVEQLIIFFNAFLILNKSNQLCVIGMDSSHAGFVWPPTMAAHSKRSSVASNGRITSSDGIGVSEELVKQLHAFAKSTPITEAAALAAANGETGSKMAGALSLGLCYLNRVHSTASSTPSGVKVRSRLLIFSLCPDQSSSYVSMMNGIFSTQKQSIPVDSCVLADMDSLFLQQASHLTKGIYSRVPTNNQHALLQYLMFMYLSDPTSRHHLILPTQTQVDYRATCFCHQQVVNMAVVCPVCLAIFCRSTPKCQICGTRFAVLNTAAANLTNRPITPNTNGVNATTASTSAR